MSLTRRHTAAQPHRGKLRPLRQETHSHWSSRLPRRRALACFDDEVGNPGLSMESATTRNPYRYASEQTPHGTSRGHRPSAAPRPSVLLMRVRAFPSSVGFDSALRAEAVVVLINTPRSSRQLRVCLTEIRAGRERVCGGWPWHIGGREMSPSSAYLL